MTTIPSADEHLVVLGDARLHVREVGAPWTPPLLMLHGIMGHCREWDVLVGRVARRCRVTVPDQRGHGRSTWAASYRVADLADDAIALVERLDLAPVPLVGHSMGAMVGLVVAARRPDLVDRLVVIDLVPETLLTDFGRQLPAMFDAMADASYASLDDAVAEWQAANPLARPVLLRNYVRHALAVGPDGRLRWRFDARGLRAFPSGVTVDELWSAVDDVHCPALVVRGEHSPVTTAEQVAAMASRLGDARVVTIAGGGHDLGIERPEAVADAVLAFLPDAAPARRRPSADQA